MFNSNFKFLMLVFAVVALVCFQSCSDDEPAPENEEELITTLIMTFTNTQDPTDVVIARFEDLDGDGGDDPVITNPTLSNGVIYNTEIQLLNESVSPPDNITAEVEEEGTAHQFFFGGSNTSLYSFAYLDEDDLGNPIGIQTQWTMLTTGSGSLQIVLRHEPDKNADGVSNGDISNAGGETDIQVDFFTTVE